MRRFDDAWVVDRTMFEYVNQSGCSCCGVTHQIMDVAKFTSQCSDWESDDEKKEQLSPWPSFIHEEILTERARLRVVMKKDMKNYKSFANNHLKGFLAWWQALSPSAKSRVLQAPDDDIMEVFRSHVRVKGSYEIVLCAVLEQLRNFKCTRYNDARAPAEADFEAALLHQKGGFTVDEKYQNSEEGMTNFLEMIRILGGPKLLPLRQARDPTENNQAEKEVAESVTNVQSFRSDRRLVRIVILRLFADAAIRKYRRELGGISARATKQEANQDDVDMDHVDADEDNQHTE